MISIGLILLILFLILVGQPLYVLIGSISAYCFMIIGEEEVKNMISDIFYAGDKEILLAIPLFVLAGTFMTQGSIARRLIRLASSVTAPIPSGLAIAAVLSCSVFAAISGSSPVTLIAIGSILYPALIGGGYSKQLSTSLLAAGGTLGIIIPPSIPMIIFAIMAGVSVTDLFKAGIGPGILLSLLLILYAMAKGPGKKATKPWDTKDVIQSFKSGIFSLLMPVVILGGIYSGFFTATESAAIAVLYAVIIELFVHRELKVSQFPKIFVEAAEMLGTLFLILVLAVSLNKFMTFQQIPQQLVDWMSAAISGKVSFLIAVNILLLAVGCVMDVMSAILVLAPILTPIAIHFGVDPVHFGIIMIVNLEIGYLTPPIGINLFVASGIFNEPLGNIIKWVLPLIGVLLIGLILVTAFPSISLFLL
jgi:C4-dicarboxylate transporter DctM subunit